MEQHTFLIRLLDLRELEQILSLITVSQLVLITQVSWNAINRFMFKL